MSRFPTLFAVLMVCAVAPIAAGDAPIADPFLVAARGTTDGPNTGQIVPTSAFVAPSVHSPGSPIAFEAGGFATAGDQPFAPPPVYPTPPFTAPPANSYGYDRTAHAWGWQIMPDGLIYRSYQAGPRESRLALHTFSNRSSQTGHEWLWDATLGGRKALFRYGNNDPVNPIGWQVDLEGAAIVRLNLDEARDVDASDFRFGVPVTYTAGDGVSYKFGYYHLSSHLGDEFIARTGTNSRINYVRDALLAGVSYQLNPYWRVYGETAFAFFTAGGAQPWEFQFGAEYSRPGPTGFVGTPFFATNAHLREELDFGGDWTLQAGWLWRGDTGTALRLGLHYMNGKSTQYQFFTANEEQVGVGLWYDF